MAVVTSDVASPSSSSIAWAQRSDVLAAKPIDRCEWSVGVSAVDSARAHDAATKPLGTNPIVGPLNGVVLVAVSVSSTRN
jgi:hypothetical protein